MAVFTQKELTEILSVIEQLDASGVRELGLEVEVTDVNGELLGYIVGPDDYQFKTNKEEF